VMTLFIVFSIVFIDVLMIFILILLLSGNVFSNLLTFGDIYSDDGIRWLILWWYSLCCWWWLLFLMMMMMMESIVIHSIYWYYYWYWYLLLFIPHSIPICHSLFIVIRLYCIVFSPIRCVLLMLMILLIFVLLLYYWYIVEQQCMVF
jgi:hypothetical protein